MEKSEMTTGSLEREFEAGVGITYTNGYIQKKNE
jgi:hypothetical protein